jgi:hypothetical protein
MEIFTLIFTIASSGISLMNVIWKKNDE